MRPDAIHDPPQQPITSELIEQVRTRLPKQPWPQGIHREIAAELGIPLSVVRRTIDELIRRGDFHLQENAYGAASLKHWRDALLKELKDMLRSPHTLHVQTLKDVFKSLDFPKQFIFEGYEWVKAELPTQFQP